MIKKCEAASNGTFCEFHRDSGGYYFVFCYKNSARICKTAADIKAAFGRAKNTESAKAVYQWAKELEDNILQPSPSTPSSPDTTG